MKQIKQPQRLQKLTFSQQLEKRRESINAGVPGCFLPRSGDGATAIKTIGRCLRVIPLDHVM